MCFRINAPGSCNAEAQTSKFLTRHSNIFAAAQVQDSQILSALMPAKWSPQRTNLLECAHVDDAYLLFFPF